MSPETITSNDAGNPERYGTVLGGYRRAPSGVPAEPEQRNGVAYELAEEKPRLPSLDPDALPEPHFAEASWLDSPTDDLADHPLLRGLLLELPPRGSTPPPDWLDRWFEATRSILELLYVK
jgi:hypothetical protein